VDREESSGASRLLSAPWVLPIATPEIAEGAVALAADDTILAVGPRRELRARYPELPEERGLGALLPGLVNAHTHVELSALAGRVPGGGGFVPWGTKLMAERAALAPTTIVQAAHAAARAAVAAGTAAVGDVCGRLDDAVPALAEAGLHGIVFHELVGSREARTGDALADAGAERDAFVATQPWPRRLAYVPAPHAPYSVGAPLFRRIFAAAAAAGVTTSVHLAEDDAEIELLLHGTGAWPPVLERMGVPTGSRTPKLRPVRYLEALGAFAGARAPLLVHMVCADHEDRALAGEHAAPVVLCARSNLHIGGRLPDVPALVREGLALALGTDSLASSPDLSLWGEVATLAARFPDIAPAAWLALATRGGAEALGLPALGVLAPGKRPGVLDVALGDSSAPYPSLVSDPHPRLRWMARP
jgi:cytosine/adenosine deaminase-related metal-dependent hydrolase